MGIRDEDVTHADDYWIWVDPEPIKEQMLDFFTHYFQPRIYVIDNNFQDGGLLLLHRDDGRSLRNDWIKPTLHNLHLLWKGPVYLLSLGTLHGYRAGSYRQDAVEGVSFTEVCERMREQRIPFVVEKSG